MPLTTSFLGALPAQEKVILIDSKASLYIYDEKYYPFVNIHYVHTKSQVRKAVKILKPLLHLRVVHCMPLWLSESAFIIKILAFVILFSFAGASNVNKRLQYECGHSE